ncbi:MAG: AAA family ATPase [Deltaproteobacteria bacterium]|nr:AAA family ATPase [Deltaproteobacteria bacterium]
MMFCDLVGSTELAQSVDAEELPLIIGEYQNTCVQVIREFDGYVAEYLGDGILVYFGYPHAHEDDAVRGVNAALAMQAAMPALNIALGRRLPAFAGRSIEMRIGVHSGLVVLSDMGRGGEPHRFGVGDTLNIAARIQAMAEGGKIVISESTERLVSGAFELAGLGATQLKGVDQPIELFAVDAATEEQSRLERSAQAGLTPLVGRKQEIALALERWEQARSGQGQAVLLSGEPGIGKSRLVAVVRERLEGEPLRWLTCRCTAHRENTAFYPVIDMFERQFEIEQGDSQDRRREKLETGLSAANIHDRQIAPIVDLMTEVDDSDDDTSTNADEDPRSQILESLTACLGQMSRTQPLILVFEDLHWVDPSTLELIGLLLAQSIEERVLLIFTSRPEFEMPWDPPRELVQIQLNPLTRDQVAELCAAVAGERTLPEEVLSELVAKADGVPFFAEELTKAVLEADWLEQRDNRLDPTRGISVPSTLRESLMSRLDGQGATKELLQLCAVIGREASYELLRVVASQSEKELQNGLRRLVAADLLSREGPAHQARYLFRHALIHDTAYDSLLRGDRQSLHIRIAQAMAKRFPGVATSRPEDLARHYAAGDDIGNAVLLYHRAAKQAIDRLAHLEAIGHLGTAIDLLGRLPESAERDRLELEMQIALGTSSMIAEGQGDERVELSHARARDLSRQLGDDDGLFRALWGLSRFHQSRGEPVASYELGQQMLELAKSADDPARLIWSYLALGQARFWRGNPAKALSDLEATIETCRLNPDSSDVYMFGQDPALSSWALVGPVEWILGRVDRAVRHGGEAVELASKAEDPFTHAFVLNFAAVVHQLRGERERALELAEAAIEICTERGFPLFMGFGLVMKGWALSVDPNEESGVAQMQRGLTFFQETHTGLGGPYLLALLTEALRVIGREREALTAVDSALSLSANQQSYFWDPELLRLKAEILVSLDPTAGPESEALLRQAIDAARDRGAASFELRSAMSLFRLLDASDRSGEARELVRRAYDRFEEGFDSANLIEAKALLSAS